MQSIGYLFTEPVVNPLNKVVFINCIIEMYSIGQDRALFKQAIISSLEGGLRLLFRLVELLSGQP